MAADVPFGLSFGDPRRYMGSSPLADVGKALKTGLLGYAIQESGLEKMLNEKGVKKTSLGGYKYDAPQGSVPPVNAPAQAVAPNASAPMPVNPNVTPTFNAPPAQVTVTPVIDYGAKILDNDYDGSEQSFVNPQAQRDFNPFVPQTTPNPVALTGNEYQQVPGYGKLAKAMQAMSGGMFG
jgi:hypothetical protein